VERKNEMIAEKYINPLQLYRDSEKNYLDFTASLETSFKEGKIERDIEIAKNMIKKGFENETIAEVTGLSIEQIEALRVEMSQ
jgi:predicted transposase/invertase (TIGR01784 family)